MKRLTYIEGTGTQYIDTLFTPDNNSSVEMEVSFSTAPTDTNALFGSRISATSRNFSIMKPQGYTLTFYYDTFWNSSLTPSANVRYKFKMDKENAYIDGTLVHTFSSATFTCPSNAVIWGLRTDATKNLSGKFKLYSCRFWDDGVLVRDFIPVKDDNDVVCLYDNVSGTYYYNAGSGNFIAGAEYLEDLLSNQQLDFNNWTKVAGNITFSNSYDSSGNVNTLTYKGADGYEHFYTAVSVEQNTDYVWNLQFCSPSGFICDYGQNAEYIGVSATAPTTTQAFPVSNFLAHTSELNKNARQTLQDYTVTFNSGNRSTIYLVVDTGYMRDGVTVTLKYKFGDSTPTPTRKYLLKSGNDYYTISGGVLTNIGSTLNAQLFADYGLDTIPDWSDYSSLSNPSVLCWDSAEIVDMVATTTGLPTAQTFVTEGVSLVQQGTDGIDNIDITDTGAPKWAFSVDAGNTWKVWSGSAWVASSGSDMTSAQVEALTNTEWDLLTSGASAMKIRFTLSASSDGVSKIEVFYKQA